jgi:hypothetical protein
VRLHKKTADPKGWFRNEIVVPTGEASLAKWISQPLLSPLKQNYHPGRSVAKRILLLFSIQAQRTICAKRNAENLLPVHIGNFAYLRAVSQFVAVPKRLLIT